MPNNAYEFTRNNRDLSNRNGYQFEFYCDRCQSGFRTNFKPSAIGTIANAVDAASSLFGGLFNKADTLVEKYQSAYSSQNHDQAFKEAIAELKPQFNQCPHCSSWVCKNNCWNVQRGLCKKCAPDIGVEMAAAQASRTTTDIWTNAQTSTADQQTIAPHNFENQRFSQCPSCHSPLAGNERFCQRCGHNLAASSNCRTCGNALMVGARFCGDCGTPVPTT